MPETLPLPTELYCLLQISPVLTGSTVRETAMRGESPWSRPKSTLPREVRPSWTSSLFSRLFSPPPSLHFTQFWVRPELRGRGPSEVNSVITSDVSQQNTQYEGGEPMNPIYVNYPYYIFYWTEFLFVCFQLCWKFIGKTCKDSGLASFPNNNNSCIMIYNLNIIEDEKIQLVS